jgi:uncharacterized protein YoxC
MLRTRSHDEGELPMIATGADVALIILAGAWAVLVAGLIYVLMSTHAVLQSTKILIDTMREEVVPLLREGKGTIERTNRELDRVDGMLESAGVVVGRVERLSGLVEQAAASPLVKVISFGAGIRQAASRVTGGRKRRTAT